MRQIISVHPSERSSKWLHQVHTEGKSKGTMKSMRSSSRVTIIRRPVGLCAWEQVGCVSVRQSLLKQCCTMRCESSLKPLLTAETTSAVQQCRLPLSRLCVQGLTVYRCNGTSNFRQPRCKARSSLFQAAQAYHLQLVLLPGSSGCPV